VVNSAFHPSGIGKMSSLHVPAGLAEIKVDCVQVPGFKRGPGRPRANWIGKVKKDLRKMTLTWEEAEVAALDMTSMASECGPMHPLGCGLNQG